MKLLFLPKYGPQAASCRYRVLQYLPFLRAQGIDCTVSPLFDDDYLDKKFSSGRADLAAVLRAFWRRTAALVGAGRYDLVVLQYEALPYLPLPAESALAALGTPYVYDFDDAIFHNYDQSPNPLVRLLLHDKIRRIIAGSALVLAGSAYLADYARAVQPRVEVLPTVIDLDRYPDRAGDPHAARPFTIGWIGSPSTADYLDDIAPALRALSAERPVCLVLIGSGPRRIPGVPLRIVPWSEASEVAELRRVDVGIMPLPDTPWARGKCGFKLIQYMACGLPVVASPVGENVHIVEDGVSGLWAGSSAQWHQALRLLCDDPALRARLGRAGRHTVEARYCLQVTAPRLLRLLRSAAGFAETGSGGGARRDAVAAAALGPGRPIFTP